MKIPRISQGEESLATQLKWHGIAFRREVAFDSKRKWRFDFLLEGMLAVEVEGGIGGKSRHTSAQGYAEDCHKYNAAAFAGYRVLRYTTKMVQQGIAIQEIARLLNRNSPDEPRNPLAKHGEKG